MSTLAHPLVAVRSRPRDATIALGLAALGFGLAAVALLGPLASGLVDYRVSETLRNQTIGLDAVSLFVVAPLALAAAVLVARGHPAGLAAALGIGPYVAYMFLQYVLGPDYVGLPGNNEVLFPLCAALFAGGWIVALAAWNALPPDALPRSRRRELLLGRVVMPALALLVFVRYVPALADAMAGAPEEGGYLAGPAFFWSIALLDLGVLLPATVATCVGLVRGARWAPKAMYLVAGWFGLVGPAVAAMAVVMAANDDPNASGANVAVMSALGVAFALVAVAVYVPFLRSGRPAR